MTAKRGHEKHWDAAVILGTPTQQFEHVQIVMIILGTLIEIGAL